MPRISGDTFDRILARRFSRRSFLKGSLAAAPLLVFRPGSLAEAIGLGPGNGAGAAPGVRAGNGVRAGFTPISRGKTDTVTVPEGYEWHVVVRWGDPIHADSPPFDFRTQTIESQSAQFGYNCDFTAVFPVEGRSDRLLLCVNHEFTNPPIMFPDHLEGFATFDQVGVELAAHGISIVEIRRQADGSWAPDVNSPYNRRCTMFTPMTFTGAAAGHAWLRTGDDPEGTRVLGTLNNCAGGKTPWNTYLTCEENFHKYFGKLEDLPADDPRRSVHEGYGVRKKRTYRQWEDHYPRFRVPDEPNEPFRFGWVVEIDPFDEEFVPRKHTALGRMKHEGATPCLTKDGRVAVYMGDDEVFQHVYKFVSDGTWKSGDRETNRTLFESGTLYTARFDENGKGEWLPIVFGQGPLTSANGFESQGDVLIDTRRAARLLGATKMDRPEDIAVSPRTGYAYVALTNNTDREEPNAANPRVENRHGHVIELRPEDGDHADRSFAWDILLMAGDPEDDEDGARYGDCPPGSVSPISCPDNLLFDRDGGLWICTDGQSYALGLDDGISTVALEGPGRGLVRPFACIPSTAECTGPEFSPDETSLFLAVQHPGEGGSLDRPLSSFPDGSQPPRPTVISIRKKDGGTIGT
ncbi:MAG: PhoX family phosphatase [Gemmatimonadetes bacterium]|nr:PhoX family phosphatase [Gemmatimonadota bacterium]